MFCIALFRSLSCYLYLFTFSPISLAVSRLSLHLEALSSEIEFHFPTTIKMFKPNKLISWFFAGGPEIKLKPI